MLVFNGPKLLLIERKKFPYGFAPPAGHVDGDISFDEAGKRELYEEVGLETISIKLIAEGRKEYPCSRIDGSWHYWKIFQATARGTLKANKTETVQVQWFTPQHIKMFATRTKKYLAKQTSAHDWKLAPGIELVCYEWFQDLGLIPESYNL